MLGFSAVGELPVSALPAAGGGAGTAYALSGASGSYAVAGQSATLAAVHNYFLNGSAGGYTIAGQAATLTYASGAVAYTLSGAFGLYIQQGQNASLAYSPGAGIAYSLLGSVGQYVVAGQPADFAYSGTVVVGGADYGTTKRKKYIVRRGDQLLVFASKADALNALPKEESKDAKQKKVIKHEVVEVESVVVDEQAIDLKVVESLIEQYKARKDYELFLRRKHYEALIGLYHKLRQREEEEIAAILLLAA